MWACAVGWPVVNVDAGGLRPPEPKNHKKKCSSYDWERGLGTCHNCNKSYQLHTYERKGATDKEYIRPVDPPKEEFNIPHFRYSYPIS